GLPEGASSGDGLVMAVGLPPCEPRCFRLVLGGSGVGAWSSGDAPPSVVSDAQGSSAPPSTLSGGFPTSVPIGTSWTAGARLGCDAHAERIVRASPVQGRA